VGEHVISKNPQPALAGDWNIDVNAEARASTKRDDLRMGLEKIVKDLKRSDSSFHC
jgi:hypothetical protein